jgi:hypothetical protein
MVSQPTSLSRLLAPVAALIALIGLSGCVTDSRNSMAALPASSGQTLAFESVDGPPPEVFDALMKVLDSEAQTRNLAIVSREGAATYRLRGYYSAQVRKGQATIAWVWDIYDRNEERQLRLSGEEPAGRAGANAWAAANDRLLRGITKQGMDGLAGLLGGTSAPVQPETPPSAQPGPAIAAAPPATTGAMTASLGFNRD